MHGQFNPETNSNNSSITLENNTSKENHLFQSQSTNSIICNPNSFFGIRANGDIEELTLVGSTITLIGLIQTGGGRSLAYCNNLNNTTMTPTFYSDSTFIRYYNGINWSNTNISTPGTNIGGNGNNLFYTSKYQSSPFHKIINKYNGINASAIFSRQNRLIGVADLAVDDNGNVYFTSAIDSTTFISDSIFVISSSGQIIKQLPFTYNYYHAYGSFILNNVFYIRLGSSNSINPNTLLPITFNNNSAVAGTPINMPPNSNYYDLASCRSGLPLSIKPNITSKSARLYPNPLANKTTLTFADNYEFKTIRILNLLGEELRKFESSENILTIEKENLRSGIYFISINISGQNKFEIIKLMVE